MDQLENGGRVDDRLGVRWQADGGNAGGRRGPALAGDGGFMLGAGFAQAGTQVDQSGTDDLALHIQPLVGMETIRCRPDGDDPPVGDVEVLHRIERLGRINQAATV